MCIVTLPDFVVDVAVDTIKDATATTRGQLEPLDVGGRAGRLAWVLHNFGGQKNAWFSTNYVAKAGDVGTVVLKRRFARPFSETGLEPTSLRYIVPSRESQNWLHVYGNMVETVESSHEGLGVSTTDIDESPYSLTDLFVEARFIVIASKHTDHAKNAITLVTEGLRRLSAKYRYPPDSRLNSRRIPLGVLLDLSSLGEASETESVVDLFAQIRQETKGYEIEATVLCESNMRFNRDPFDHVIERDPGGIRLNGGAALRIDHIATHPVSRESLTAGYVLASSCSLGWKLLRQWHSYCSKMRPIDRRPHQSYPTREEMQAVVEGSLLPNLAGDGPPALSATECLRFGVLMAQHTTSKPLSYYDLVKAVAESNPPTEDIELTEASLAFKLPHAREFITDSGGISPERCLVPRFEDESAIDTRSLFLTPTEPSDLVASCRLRDARSVLSERYARVDKAVMFDLDATLIDSGGMLKACWFNGLRALLKDIGISAGSGDIHTGMEVYETYVYKNHERFIDALRDHPDIPSEWQPCDFRQVWNHRYAWAALIWMLGLRLSSSHVPRWGDMRKALAEHRSTRKGVRCRCEVCQRLEPLWSAHPKDVAEQRKQTQHLRERLVVFKFAIQAARSAFWEVDYACYPQARSCVQMIRNTPGCEVYVVTEGHEETQLQKIKCAGLADLFPRSHVLSTGAASAALQLASDLDKLSQANEYIKKWIGKIEGLPGSLYGHITLLLSSTKFLKDLLKVMQYKRNDRFYSAVIDAVRRRPESPAQLLQSFLERRDEALAQDFGGGHPMKFFMIGDRYDNDCQPLLGINLSTEHKIGVGTCRLLSGKRAWDYCPPRSEDGKAMPPTMFVCDTLAQIGHILQVREVWDDVALLDRATPSILLVSQAETVLGSEREIICYSPDPKTSSLKPLHERLGDMSWARADEFLRTERSVHHMLDQIERDLAACEVRGLFCLFEEFAVRIKGWWDHNVEEDETVAPEMALTLLKGSVRILANVNWWRHALRCAMPPRPLPATQCDNTLEWALGSCLLRRLMIPRLTTAYGDLQWADPRDLDGIGPVDILNAIPYSPLAVEIITALKGDADSQLGMEIWGWLNRSEQLQSVEGV